MGRNVSGDGILEQGNIYFLYRPKVEKERARNRNDVFKDLKLNRREHPTRPLFQGKWE